MQAIAVAGDGARDVGEGDLDFKAASRPRLWSEEYREQSGVSRFRNRDFMAESLRYVRGGAVFVT